MKPTLTVVDDLEAVASEALKHVTERVEESVRAHGRFTLALSGGSTPQALYRRMANYPNLPWPQIELCFGDERAVPPDHPDSNARMAAEALTSRPFIAAGRVHRMRGELPPDVAAARYEHTLRTLFQTSEPFPRFDLILLGLGDDGHTASLFPGTEALAENIAWVRGQRVEKLDTYRITLTFPVLNAAADVLFLVHGSDKALALREVLEGVRPISEIPARGVQPTNGTLRFVVDKAAASALTSTLPAPSRRPTLIK